MIKIVTIFFLTLILSTQLIASSNTNAPKSKKLDDPEYLAITYEVHFIEEYVYEAENEVENIEDVFNYLNFSGESYFYGDISYKLPATNYPVKERLKEILINNFGIDIVETIKKVSLYVSLYALLKNESNIFLDSKKQQIFYQLDTTTLEVVKSLNILLDNKIDQIVNFTLRWESPDEIELITQLNGASVIVGTVDDARMQKELRKFHEAIIFLFENRNLYQGVEK